MMIFPWVFHRTSLVYQRVTIQLSSTSFLFDELARWCSHVNKVPLNGMFVHPHFNSHRWDDEWFSH
jgi:hypothetical protein